MSTLIMTIGLPGSGKSTWAKAQGSHFDYFSTDKYIEEEVSRTGEPYGDVFKRMKGPHLRERMLREFKESISQGHDIIVDRVNASREMRHAVLSHVPDHYHKVAHVFGITRDLLDIRLKNRAEKTGKVIPEYVVNEREAAFQYPGCDEFDQIIYHDNVALESISSKAIGRTVAEIEDARSGSEWFSIKFQEGGSLWFQHEQEEGESVVICNVIGNTSNIIGNALTALTKECEYIRLPQSLGRANETCRVITFTIQCGEESVKVVFDSFSYENYGGDVTVTKTEPL